MWTKDYSLTTDAPADAVWALLADVAGWGSWNDGIESIVVDEPVALGTIVRMTPPGGPELTSTIVDLQPGRVLTDRTELDGVVVRVEHRLAAAPDGRTVVTYAVEVTGAVPDEVAAQIGTEVSADFPDVLANLVAAAAGRRG